MSTPGDPFDPSLVLGFGKRDPHFLPAPIFTGLGEQVDQIYAGLVRSDAAWSLIRPSLLELRDAARQVEAVVEATGPRARNQEIIKVQEMLSASVHNVLEARDLARLAYGRGLAQLRKSRRR